MDAPTIRSSFARRARVIAFCGAPTHELRGAQLEALDRVRGLGGHGIDGVDAFVLETCARHELYVSGDDEGLERWTRAVAPLWARLGLVRCDEEALRHLARVASGLDSPLAGDREVTAQIKLALAEGQRAGTAGAGSSMLVTTALRIARRTRQVSGIDQLAVGLGRAVGRLVEPGATLVDGGPGGARRRVVVVGTGMAARSVARALRRDAQLGQLVVAGRSPERARRLAAEVGATAVELLDLPSLVSASDVLVLAVPRLDTADVQALGAAIGMRIAAAPLLVVDLSADRWARSLVAARVGSHRPDVVRCLDLDDVALAVRPSDAAMAEARALAELTIAQEMQALRQRSVAEAIDGSLKDLYLALPGWLAEMSASLTSADGPVDVTQALRSGVRSLLHSHARLLREVADVTTRATTWATPA